MIFYGNNKNKLVALSFLVIATTSLIGWLWLKLSPWRSIAIQPSPEFQQAGQELRETISEAKDNFSVGQDKIKESQTELSKIPQRQALLEEANQYILEKEIEGVDNKITE